MNLDPFQKAAAETTEPRVLVSACPGSGKSRTVCARFEHMVETMHIPSSQIAMITFTRYASNELRNRIGPSINQAFCGTFHAFALKIVEMYGDTRKWDASYLTILDEAEASLDEDEVLADLGFKNRKGAWSRITAGEWDSFKKAIVCGQNEKITAGIMSKCRPIWEAFCERLRAQNVMTFALIMSEAMELMKNRKIMADLRDRYRHFIVDEGQDCDARQYDLINKFQPETIFLVGDIDQSIFEWRAARPDLFLKFAEGSVCYNLPNSYRFGIKIAEPANRLIKFNTKRLDTAINAIAENRGTVNVCKGASYQHIAEIVKEELKNHAPEEIAVLGRRHVTLDWAKNALTKAGIPATKIGGETSVTNSAEYRAVRGYLRLSVNPGDRRAFAAISAPEHISVPELWAIREKMLAAGDKTLADTYGKEIPKTLEAIETHLMANDPQHDYAQAVDYVRQLVREEAIVDNKELVKVLAMEGMQDQMRTVKKSVACMTIHGSKGLEWKSVILIGLNSLQWPSPRAVREGRNEEERRLAYVGMTRAESRLHIVSGEPESAKDGDSVFLTEAGL